MSTGFAALLAILREYHKWGTFARHDHVSMPSPTEVFSPTYFIMNKSQRAIFVTEIGKPVELGEREIPSPKAGQVLVKVTATMLLPHDTYGRGWGILVDQRLPAVLGSNVAGVVEEVGAGVSLQVGDKIFGISFPEPTSSDQSGLQQYAVLNANAVGKIPEGFSDEQVVTLPINIVTSWTTLFTEVGFGIPPPFAQDKKFDYTKARIVIIGGGTNVGQLAVQLARIASIGTIVAIAGPSNFAKLKSMGATHVIDRHETPDTIHQEMQKIAGLDDGFNRVYNCAPLQVDVVAASLSTNQPSKVRLLLPLEGDEKERLVSQRPLCDVSFIDDLTNDFMAPYAERFWEEVPRWLVKGEILPTEYRVIDGLEKVEAINEALDGYRDFTRAGPQVVVKM